MENSRPNGLRPVRGPGPAIVASAGVAALAVVALAGPVLAPYPVSIESMADSLGQALLPPSVRHPFGTDWHGVDIFSEVLAGARASLAIGLGASAASCGIGLVVGTMAGYSGGWMDALLMRFADLVLAFPSLLLAILLAASMGSGLWAVFLAIALSGWPPMARMVRSLVISLAQQEYVLAAVGAGAGPARVIACHILPNCLPALLILFTLRIGGTILTEASLGFLGLGAPPTTPSWGAMVFRGMDHLRDAPWCAIWPATAIAATVLCFNSLGDGVAARLDPKMRDVL